MPNQLPDMSEVLKEMSEVLLRNPCKSPTPEAAVVALFFANVAWNECVGLGHDREDYRNVWEELEADSPALWNEFKSKDIDAIIDVLIQYKLEHFAEDERRILACGIPDGKIRVGWLKPAAAGVDSRWEMRLYGLVRSGARQKAIAFLQKTRNISQPEAGRLVAKIATELGCG